MKFPALATTSFVLGLALPLAAATWESGQGFRSMASAPAGTGKTGFTLMPNTALGIGYTNYLAYDTSVTNHNYLNGSGVALGDYDGDGRPDIYFCNKSGRTALYRNLGNWKFEDVTEKAGVLLDNYMANGAVFADVNGDGKPDLLVSGFGTSNQLFINRGDGTFTNMTEAAGLKSKNGCQSFALADIDGNGSLDLYVANYGAMSVLRSGGEISIRTVNGKSTPSGRFANRIRIIDGKMIELGEPHFLYRNDGKGNFTAASWRDGTFLDEEGRPLSFPPMDMGLSAAFHDLNGDGAPDLYVCNDFQTPDRIWLNDGKGHFRAIPRPAIRATPHFSMGVDFADIDRDGHVDFFVCDMLSRFHSLRMTQSNSEPPPRSHTFEPDSERPQNRRNSLFRSRGDGTYADIAQFAGVDASDWSWCPVFLDVDLDGYEDLLISNGHAYDTQDLDMNDKVRSLGNSRTPRQSYELLRMYPALATPNVLFRNRGDRTFEEVGEQWGFNSKLVTHGVALADLDGDGDLDVVANTFNGPPLIYRNDSPAPRIAVQLRGNSPNTAGIGAKIRVLGGPVPQSQEMIAGGRYLSGDQPIRTFAAGKATALSIEVTWRNGTISRVPDAKPNRLYEVDEAGAQAEPSVATAAKPVPLFQDVSEALNHRHTDRPFDDLARQPLLFRKLSQGGPALAVVDLDGDGRDDLIIGSGAGGKLAAFRSEGAGKFSPLSAPALDAVVVRDQTGIAAWRSGGVAHVLVASSNYEDGDTSAPSLVEITFSKDATTSKPIALPLPKSIGPLALGELTGGTPVLFVGGSVLPGRYPEADKSMLLRRQPDGSWIIDAPNSAKLAGLGITRAAVFADLNGDGQSDLVVATEWGAVRVFLNRAGVLEDATQALGLGAITGWWQSLAILDADGDGRLDIVAGNWGLNSGYRATPRNPAGLFFGDIGGLGAMDLVEYYSELTPGTLAPRRSLAALASAMPFLRDTYADANSFSKARLPELLGPRGKSARNLTVNTLASTVFLNRGDHFEARPLPNEAQLSPAMGLAAFDADGDGLDDLVIAQNFFPLHPEQSRLDAGRSLLLINRRNGDFAPMAGANSGLLIYGEQRAVGVGDFAGDGKPSLSITQNGDATRLLLNRNGNHWLHVRTSETGIGIGATVVPVSMDGKPTGPARTLGSAGVWIGGISPAAVRVTMPGGKAVIIPTAGKDVIKLP